MQHEPNATDAPAVLKISEVISVMRISRTAVYEGARNSLRTDGAAGIPCVRVGRSIRFPRLLLEQYLKQPITADQLSHPYDPTDTDPLIIIIILLNLNLPNDHSHTQPYLSPTLPRLTNPSANPTPSRSNDKSRTNTRQQNQTVARGRECVLKCCVSDRSITAPLARSSSTSPST